MAKSSDKNRGTKSGGDNKANSSSTAKKEILIRVRILYLLFIVIGFAVAARLVWVQVFSPSVEHNAKVLKEGVMREVSIPAHRGAILTRDGKPLAMSSLRYEPTFDFKSDGFNDASRQEFNTNVDSLSNMLARHFSPEDALAEGYKYISAAEYKELFHKELQRGTARAKRVFPRPVTLDEWNMMTASFPILNHNMGLVYGVNPVEKRIRPMGELAYQVIGGYNTLVDSLDNRSSTGIEGIYDKYLAGSNGSAKEQYIAHGFWSRVNDPSNVAPKDGYDVVTTIDGGLQRAATDILRKELERHEGTFGTAMVMEVETGDILCMVNLSTGTERGTDFSEKRYNHALKTSQCPGSTFKLAASLILVEKCGYTLDTKIKIPNKQQTVGSRLIKDSHTITLENGKPMVDVSLKDAFAHSSNIYFASAVYDNFKDNPKQYWEYINELGFNGTVGLDKYEEVAGKLIDPTLREWRLKYGVHSISLPYLGYGYIIEVPAIHTLTFFNGVANKGRMVAPRLVDHIENDGQIIERMPTEVLVERLCSDQTLDVLYSCLEAAADPARSKRRFAHLPFNVGCKTGTSEIQGKFISHAEKDIREMNAGIDTNDGYNLGSIVCMMPLEKPKYTVMVTMLKQRRSSTDTRFGIDVAGPAASDIMLYLYNNDHELHPEVGEAPSPYTPVSIKGGDSGAVRTTSEALAAYVGDNAANAAWCNTTTDIGGNVTINGVEVALDTVPDVSNMGLSDALYILESLGMNVTHEGSGRIVTQSVAAGTAMEECSGSIHLKLEI